MLSNAQPLPFAGQGGGQDTMVLRRQERLEAGGSKAGGSLFGKALKQDGLGPTSGMSKNEDTVFKSIDNGPG